MKEINSLEEIWEIELGIMDYIHNVCEENNLRYYLVGGSMIGAVRHKGFIPWDDDMDIDMPREDYERFKEIVKESENSQFMLLTDETPGYWSCLGKLVDKRTKLIESNYDNEFESMGVFVDIIPVDGLPEDKNKRMAHFKHMEFYKKCVATFAFNKPIEATGIFHKFYQRFLFLYGHLEGTVRLKKKLNGLAKRYDFDASPYACCVGGAYGYKEIFPHLFFDGRELTEFEGRRYYIPKHYHEFLTQMYGDYMQLPPKDKQTRNHTARIYWR